MGFLVNGSTGERALAILKAMPQGTVLLTPDLASRLGVKICALHQLLANATRLRLIKKVRRRGAPCVGWALGPGNDSATIERRQPQMGAPRVRRRPGDPSPALRPTAAGARRFVLDPPWPPDTGSISGVARAATSPPSAELAGLGGEAGEVQTAPSGDETPLWLRGLVPSALPPSERAPAN